MWSRTAVASVALGLLTCGGFGGVASADPPAPPPPAPAPATTMNHDGVFAVGTDIVAGNYSTPGPVGDGTCYWKRVGSDDKIIDNALTKKSQIVQILASDKSFKTSGCQPWQLTDEAPPAPAPPVVAIGQLGGLINTITNGAQQALPH